MMRSITNANIELCRARLNTLLELKLENERLQHHISTLRAHSHQLSATHPAQHMISYTGDDLTAQLTANLGLPTRSTIVEDEGDTEPRRKKVRHVYDLASVACCPDTPFSQLKKSAGGEQYICNTCGQTVSPEWRKVNPLFTFARSLANFSGS